MANRVVVGALLALVSAGSAFAGDVAPDQVDMRFRGVGPSSVIRTEVWMGNSRIMNMNLAVGALRHEFSDRGTSSMSQLNNQTASALDGQIINTFCTDIMESVDNRWQRYEVRDVTQAPVNGRGDSAAMGADRGGRLAQLYNYGLAQGLLDSMGGWASNASSAANNAMAAAWQVLVWEIVFDNPNDSNWASTGALRFGTMGSDIRNFFVMFRDASAAYDEVLGGLRGVARSGSQDQLVIIPLPPAALAGLGLMGLVAGANYVRRRRLQRQ